MSSGRREEGGVCVERSLLYKIHVDNYSVIFLNGVTNEAAMPMQIIVEDYASDLFQDALRAYGVEYSHSNLEPRHKEQSPYEESLNYNSTTFWDWTTINSWISKMQQKYPLLKKQILALTYEGREVFTLSFTKNKKNPIIVIVGGEQGKDRNSVAIIIALLHELLEDNIFYELLDYLSFYFIPIMNPDGYVYSMEKSEFWAKNRRVFFPKRKCDWTLNDEDNVAIGVNMERNWYYENELNTQEDICNTVYLGHKSLSEKETHGLASFLNDHAAKLMGYINVIGYGNRLITLPYANTLQQSINHGIMGKHPPNKQSRIKAARHGRCGGMIIGMNISIEKSQYLMMALRHGEFASALNECIALAADEVFCLRSIRGLQKEALGCGSEYLRAVMESVGPGR
ncbi:unnamed protein product [Chilo suppressalis]|uniref:Peptidase M14 domain-containing protein n=1 Tax=Chilo suppressalis TaxID=168631 RepID=A0ABN8BAW6_CHISP|nr:hypothetical protein evm_012083 [Chilo suppressalis]CAH0405817.1 unnamed protein product [Chilo suppressalis]